MLCFSSTFTLVFLCLFFLPEDGGDIFPQNVGWLSTDYTPLNPRQRNNLKNISTALDCAFPHFLGGQKSTAMLRYNHCVGLLYLFHNKCNNMYRPSFPTYFCNTGKCKTRVNNSVFPPIQGEILFQILLFDKMSRRIFGSLRINMKNMSMGNSRSQF
jgi:hypothetical protein